MALSESDKKLSSSQQNAILKAQSDYNAAKERGDTEGMNSAHSAAEAIRSQASGGTYSGSVDGSGAYSVSKTGNTSNKAPSIGTALSATKDDSGNITVKETKQGIVNSGTSQTPTTGRVYSSDESGVAQKGLKAGDLVVTEGGTYIINGLKEDGTYDSALYNSRVTRSNYGGSYEKGNKGITTSSNSETTTGLTDASGKSYTLTKDSSGNIVTFDNNGIKIDNPVGMLSDGTRNTYLATPNDPDKGGYAVHIVTETAPKLVDSEGNPIEVTDADGNILNSASVVVCDDGKTYIKGTGDYLGAVALEYGLDPSNIRVQIGDEYWSINGNRAEAPPLTQVQWTENDVYNQLFDALIDKGFTTMPKWDNYKKNAMSLEQALANAAQQLGGTYQQKLDDTLDQMDLKSLQTGFYGQLPTEALKRQAASATALDQQSAIYDLANKLRDTSYTEQKESYEYDTDRASALQDALSKIVTHLININKQKLDEATTQEELNLRIKELKEAALEKVEQLAAGGYDAKTLRDYANSLK